ncbi:MAG: hypothetical protein HY341_02640 [Candidatus Kerfeldbacteria bacterium]|nr:hypothetical protein [Candidatus Kerfeldbacteria bacterium]
MPASNSPEPSRSAKAIALIVITVFLAALLVVVAVFQTGGDRRADNERVNRSADTQRTTPPVPTAQEIRIANGTVIGIDATSIQMDATVDGTPRRLTVQLADGGKVFRRRIPPQTSPTTNGDATIQTDEIALSDLQAGDMISVRSTDDIRGAEIISAIEIAHPVLTN